MILRKWTVEVGKSQSLFGLSSTACGVPWGVLCAVFCQSWDVANGALLRVMCAYFCLSSTLRPPDACSIQRGPQLAHTITLPNANFLAMVQESSMACFLALGCFAAEQSLECSLQLELCYDVNQISSPGAVS